MSLLLPAHSFHIPCGSPLLAWLGRPAPRPALRAVGRCVIPPSRLSCRWARRHASFSPCVSFLATFSRYDGRGAVGACACCVGACRVRVLLMRYHPASVSCFPGFPIVMAPRIASRPGSLSPRPSPRRSCRTSGETSRAGWLCLLGMRCRSYLKTFPVNLLKLSSAMF